MENLIQNLKVAMAFFDIIKNRDFFLGKAVRQFESKLGTYIDAPCVLGVANGTDALILSLKALGIGPGDEVIVPAFSFFSTAGAIAWVNAKPVFVDIEPDSLNIDPHLIERAITQKTKAIMVAHFNGRIADMDPILAIAKKHSLAVIEDAAQAMGAKYKNKPIGSFGDMACVSFNPMKLLGGYGDGGAVITHQRDLAEKISLLRTYGARIEEVGDRHPFVGVSSRLPAFQAAVLSIKMESLDERIENARKNYFLYSRLLKGTNGIAVLPDPPADYVVNGNRFLLLTPKRDLLIEYLKTQGVPVRRTYKTPLPFLEAFAPSKYKKGDFPVAEKAANEIVVLPESASLSEKEIARIASLIRDFFHRA